MTDIDLLLFLALLINRTKNPAHIRKDIKWLIKRVPHSRRPALNLMLQSKNPYAVIAKLLDDWEDIPDEEIAAEQRRLAGDHLHDGQQHGEVDKPVVVLAAADTRDDPARRAGASKLHTDRAPTVGRDPKTGRFYSLARGSHG